MAEHWNDGNVIVTNERDRYSPVSDMQFADIGGAIRTLWGPGETKPTDRERTACEGSPARSPVE